MHFKQIKGFIDTSVKFGREINVYLTLWNAMLLMKLYGEY